MMKKRITNLFGEAVNKKAKDKRLKKGANGLNYRADVPLKLKDLSQGGVWPKVAEEPEYEPEANNNNILHKLIIF